MTLRWTKVSEDFAFDGSWRDVVVTETSIADWQAALDALRISRFRTKYTVVGSEAPLPASATDAFAPASATEAFARADSATMLRVFAGPVELVCHFFTVHEIEFDLDPRELTDQEALDDVVAFMALLADACSKPVLLTPENAHEVPILRLRPGCDAEHIPST